MSGRYAIASIAGVALQDEHGRGCRVDVVDGEGLKTSVIGRTVVALDFTTHTQLAERGPSGVRFGLRVAWMPVSLLNSVTAAMQAAIGASNTFAVIASDSGAPPLVDSINVRAVPDYQAMRGNLFTRGELSNDYVKDVLFRFISTGAGT